jgi:hypothetical protein
MGTIFAPSLDVMTPVLACIGLDKLVLFTCTSPVPKYKIF